MIEATSRTRDAVEVRQLVENWAAAVRRKDLAGILRRHSPEILMFDVPQPLQSEGIEAYEHTWETFFSWSDDPAVFDLDDLRVTAGVEVAFATAVMRCAGTEVTGEHIELDFRLTVGLRKVDGEWTVVHEHHSIPATQ